MNTPTPRTDEARRIDNGDTRPLLDEMETMERELAAERARMTTLRNALIAAFEHTGREIKRMRLNESAESGTQWISREIAKALDAAMKEESK